MVGLHRSYGLEGADRPTFSGRSWEQRFPADHTVLALRPSYRTVKPPKHAVRFCLAANSCGGQALDPSMRAMAIALVAENPICIITAIAIQSNNNGSSYVDSTK